MKLSDMQWLYPSFEAQNEGGGSPGGAPSGAPASGQPSGAGSGDGSSGAAGGSASAGAGQPGEGASQSEFEITVAGQKVKLTRDQVLEHASKGHDYTRKTQELADQKRRMEAEYSRRLQTELAKALDAQRRAPAEEQEQDPLADIRSRQDRIEQRIQDEKLDAALERIKGKFPNVNPKLLMIEAAERKVERFEDLDAVAAELNTAHETERSGLLEKLLGDANNPTVSKFREKVIAEYLQKKSKDATAGGENGSGGLPGGEAPKPPKNQNEERVAVDRLLAQLG